MPNFSGTLNANEIYTALYNMIISQRIYDITTADPSLANALRVDGTLFGDTKLYHSMDIGKSYDWLNDAEAPALLTLNRNKTQKTQSIKLDKFRQTNVTVDNYLTKRAWLTEGAFTDFNGVLISSLGGVKRVYDNGLINAFVGTQVSTANRGIITITIPTPAQPSDNIELESTNRLTAQFVAKAFADLAVNLGDNTRAYNELGFTRATPISECIVVWNAEIYNTILKIDLPTIFHKDGLEPKATHVLPARYFGTKGASGTGTGNTVTLTTADGRTVPGQGVNGAVRSLIEQTIGTINYFPGDAIATGASAPVGTWYTQDSLTNIAKIFPAEAIPFMSSFETGTMFNNPRSLTDTHFLTWGHNTLERILEKPFISMKLA
jgi:hypothetical protein